MVFSFLLACIFGGGRQGHWETKTHFVCTLRCFCGFWGQNRVCLVWFVLLAKDLINILTLKFLRFRRDVPRGWFMLCFVTYPLWGGQMSLAKKNNLKMTWNEEVSSSREALGKPYQIAPSAIF